MDDAQQNFNVIAKQEIKKDLKIASIASGIATATVSPIAGAGIVVTHATQYMPEAVKDVEQAANNLSNRIQEKARETIADGKQAIKDTYHRGRQAASDLYHQLGDWWNGR